MNTNDASPPAQGRIWFLIGGIFSVAFGALAIAIPCVTTVVIAKMVGYFLLASGVVLLFAKFPSDAPWAVGLLFGINSIFLGVSLVMYGLGLKQAREA